MKKLILILFAVGFMVVVAFFVFMGYQFYKDFKRPLTPQEIANIAYEARHSKQLNQKFIVDSIEYTVSDFKYYQKKDSTLLFANIVIENKTGHTKKYIDSFFLLKEGFFKKYYPNQDQFSVFENRLQKLKLMYILPKRTLPFLKYDLHIISKKDTTQNGMVRFYEIYREGG